MDADVKPKVFISNFSGHDYSPLLKYGEIVPITQGHIFFGSLDRVLYDVAEGIRDSTEDDYLAMSGAAIVNVIAAVLWYQKHGKVKLLNYDKNIIDYREMTINKDGLRLMFEVMCQ